MDVQSLQPQEHFIGNIKGYDPQVEVLENTPEVYRLKITKRLDGNIIEITTPNLRGGVNVLEGVLPYFPEVDERQERMQIQTGTYRHVHTGWVTITFPRPFRTPPIVFTQVLQGTTTQKWMQIRNITTTTMELNYMSATAAELGAYPVHWLAIAEFEQGGHIRYGY